MFHPFARERPGQDCEEVTAFLHFVPWVPILPHPSPSPGAATLFHREWGSEPSKPGLISYQCTHSGHLSAPLTCHALFSLRAFARPFLLLRMLFPSHIYAHLANSCSPFKFQIKYHILREASPDQAYVPASSPALVFLSIYHGLIKSFCDSFVRCCLDYEFFRVRPVYRLVHSVCS